MKKLLAAVLMGACMPAAIAAHAADDAWKAKFQTLSDQYLDQVYFHYSPTSGTLAGYHQFDTQLEDLSRKTIDAEIVALKNYQTKLENLQREKQKADQQQANKIPAGDPGSHGVQFSATLSTTGKIRVTGIVKQDPVLTPAQVSNLEQRIYTFQYHPYALNGVPVETSTTVNVYLVSTYDPVAADLEIVLSNVKSQLLTLEVIRPWEKNADNYSGICANAAFTLMERKFALPDDRLRSLVAREKQMPALFADARANLKNPPRVFTEIAIEQLPGMVSFFEHDVPLAFAEAKDPALKAEFAQSNAAVIAAMNDYLAWLKSDLLPRSNGDFRIGADAFQKKLAYDEMVDIPLDKLLEIGWANMRQNQEHFRQVAAELELGKEPHAVLEELGAMHPAPDQLMNAFRNTFDSTIGFIKSHRIVTIPSDVRPILEETPPFMRATTTASMDTPGPFETHATEAYFNVTLPDASMTPAEVEGYMHGFNIGTIVSTAVHETYPGHYIQFLWVPQAPSRVRKLLGCNTNAEGWAHYSEQMMLDEGYGQPGLGAKDARESKFLRLGQLQDALLRNARFIVGIEMHTGHMSIEEAEAFFQKEGYQSKENAVVETKRGTGDPTYLYYTLGKLEIMKLREDMKKKQGEAFSLEKFHDDFLRQGFPPIKIVRQALLGDDSPTL